MADEVKTYPNFLRNVIRESLVVDCGYEILATQFALDLAEAIKKVPEEHHPRLGLDGPDEFGDEWTLRWWYYESDESYEARYAARREEMEKKHDDLRKRYANAKARLMNSDSLHEKRSAAGMLAYVERLMKEVGCLIPE